MDVLNRNAFFYFMHLCHEKVLTIYSDVADFEVAEIEVCI